MDEETIYNLAHWITYGKMPPTYKPLGPGELQKLLEKIAPRRPMSKQPDKELREDLKLELLDWLGDRYSGAADMPYEEIVRLNDISLNVTLNNLENIVTKAQLQLVDELMDYSCEFGAELIQDGQRIVEAVPTEVLQQYKANLSGKGE